MFEGIIGCCPSDKLCRQVMLLCCIVCLLNVKIFFVLENQSEKTECWILVLRVRKTKLAIE